MSSSLELASSPDAILETKNSRQIGYWLRMDDGNYRSMKSPNFRLYAKAKVGIKNVNSLYCEAMDNSVKVQYVAGLKPGIYKDGFNSFLNPEFVPLSEPQIAEDPPQKFQRAFQKLGSLMDTDQQRYREEISETRKYLLKIYLETRKASQFSGRSHPWRILNKNYRPDPFPNDDHCSIFSGEEGLIWTSQPYHYDKAKIIGFAHQHRLTVRISPKWSWYYPGKTALIEWTH